MPDCDVTVLLAAAKQDAEAARQISYWAQQLQAAHQARTQLATMSPTMVLDALRRQR